MSDEIARCGNCKFRLPKVVGAIECSFAPDGYVDRIVHECRRFPAQRNFWGTAWPHVSVDDSCGEFRI